MPNRDGAADFKLFRLMARASGNPGGADDSASVVTLIWPGH
jgi:hypothetical protein